MKFKLIIDSNAEEEVVATLHERGPLSQQLEALILQHESPERLVGYLDDGVKLLHHSDIECIVVEDGKTYAIDRQKVRYRLRLRLYELEQMLPPSFIRINKSALANEERLERFSASFNGAVDAVFRSGYREYISRRCFAQIKRRYGL